jgi:SAM-dependent methyltransferase
LSRAHRELNRRSWNAATVAHNSHKGDQAGFLRGGGSTLFEEELGLLGDVSGKRLVHLQCNAGQDTLSLAAMGARVTGVDISDDAVTFAQGLSREAGLPATFVRSDVYDWLRTTRARYDLVFASYGVVGWLDDLATWAKGVARVLKRGGAFVYVDFHPVAWVFNERWKAEYPYTTSGRALPGPGVSDYVGRSGEGLVPWGFERGVRGFKNPHRSAEFAWGLGEIVQALLSAGLLLERLEEYPHANGCVIFKGMREGPPRRFRPGIGDPQVPLMFGLRARKR